MARASTASTARPPTTPPTIAPIGVCEGGGIGIGVADVGPGRLDGPVVGLKLLVVGIVVVEIGPGLDLAWHLEEQIALWTHQQLATPGGRSWYHQLYYNKRSA